MAASDGERTHDPTPHRREQFRREGRFPRARDAGGVLATAAVLGVLLGSRGAMGSAIEDLFRRCHGDVAAITRGEWTVTRNAAGALVALAAPAALAGATGAAVAGFAQSGLHLELGLLSFKAERLNPLPKLRELFSPKRGAVETLMSLLRVLLVGYVGYRALLLEAPQLLTLAETPLPAAGARVVEVLTRIISSVLVALAAIAAIDYAQSRFSLEKQLKMTRQELLEENRAQDGDPKGKARLRQRARALAKKRALNNVKDASVVVTNPTHVAVALRYGAKDAAPVVVAKGHDDLALAIRARARKFGIPIVESRALARALDHEVPLGHPIPGDHFAAVARILAYVMRLRGARTAASDV